MNKVVIYSVNWALRTASREIQRKSSISDPMGLKAAYRFAPAALLRLALIRVSVGTQTLAFLP